MESHSCEKNRGEGVLPTSVPPVPGTAIDDDSIRCRHIDALGRRCRMFVATPPFTSTDLPDALQDQAAELCLHHARLLWRRHRVREANAAELLASVSDFNDPASVNRFLGNLLKLVAVKRVPRRDGMALAYISQLLLNSQAAQDRRELVRLKIAELDKKNTPTRLIWDLPLRRSAEIREEVQGEIQMEGQRDDRKEIQEANAGNAAPSATSQPPPVPATPAPSASAQCGNRATAQVPSQARSAPVQPLTVAPPPRPTVSAPATPASNSGAPPGPPQRTPSVSQPPEQDIDDYPLISLAKPAWAKPARKHYRY